jgi:hypothetical protein
MGAGHPPMGHNSPVAWVGLVKQFMMGIREPIT